MATYGIRLGHTDLTASELADLTANLPDGCALWQAVGGPRAWTTETHLLNLIEFQSRVANWAHTKDAKNGRNRPKLHPFPPFAHEKRANEAKDASRAAAWEARQARRNQS